MLARVNVSDNISIKTFCHGQLIDLGGEFDEAIIQIQVMLLKLDPIFYRRDVLGHSKDHRLSYHFQTELVNA